MSVFTLKLIALALMALDHISAALGSGSWELLPFDTDPLRTAGRIAFPIFCYCIISGWQHTRSREKYVRNLCLFALISQIPFTMALYPSNLMPGGVAGVFSIQPFYLVILPLCIGLWLYACGRGHWTTLLCAAAAGLLPAVLWKAEKVWMLADSLNVMYTLALGLAVIFTIETFQSKRYTVGRRICLAAAILLLWLAYGIRADYGTSAMGLSLILVLYFTREYKIGQALAVAVWGIYFYGLGFGNGAHALSVCVGAVLICCCNGRRGYNAPWAKWLFYWFYPAHLLIIGLINAALKYRIL